ncbi:atp8.CDS.1 (mitochondrion) [Saccharomyces cerevisiae]|nr:atp8.CDS.1 [Saccharomyces cerevisiae]
MPQLVPFYFMNQLTYGFLLMITLLFYSFITTITFTYDTKIMCI